MSFLPHFRKRLNLFPCLITSTFLLASACVKAQAPVDLVQRYSPEVYKQREVHRAVEMRVVGQGAQRVYVFAPALPRLDAAKTNGKVPVILFHHGWQGMNPKNFGGLIDHLTRSGNVVIYPVYQESDKTPPQVVTDNAGQADRVALDLLAKEFGLTPDPQQVLYVGFSMGSAISLNFALDPKRYALPAPSAMVLMAPGDAYHVAKGEQARSIIGPVQLLPATLPVAVMTGEVDPIGLPTARKLFTQMCQIQSDRRVLMVLPSDEHDGVKVTAGHGSPGAPDSRYDFALSRQDFSNSIPGRVDYEQSGSLNQLDFYGYWKVIDAMLEGLKTQSLPPVVFDQRSRDLLFLGAWPGGTPFKSLRVENPCTVN